ncbi:hypothetical protein D3C86_2185770 [compost metagenome]
MQIAERTVFQQLADDVIFRQKVTPHRFHTQQAFLLCQGGQRPAFGGVKRQRFFNQHVFTGL